MHYIFFIFTKHVFLFCPAAGQKRGVCVQKREYGCKKAKGGDLYAIQGRIVGFVIILDIRYAVFLAM